MLAGVSVDYYTRLEQGRKRHPSPQVLRALGGVLGLDDEARMHLFRVAGLAPGTWHGDTTERVDPQLLRLLEAWPDHPAIVLGRAYDVVAGNQLALALFEGFGQGPNLMRKIFLDPDAHTFYRDWELVATYTTAGFRILQGRSPDDPRVTEVLASLLRESPDFERLWAQHDARGERLRSKRFRHPRVGDLELGLLAFDVKSAPGQELVVYQAEPGSPSEAALDRLRELAVAGTPPADGAAGTGGTAGPAS